MTKPLRARVEALEGQAVVTDTTAILVGSPSEKDVERLHAAGVETFIWLPDNGRDPGGAPWRRSGSE